MLDFVKILRRFVADKSGAVTVDWVALTAAVVIIGIGIIYTLFNNGDDGVAGLVTNLNAQLGVAGSNLANQVGGFPTSGGS